MDEMTKDVALKILAAHRADLSRLNVKSLSIFGSVARDEAKEGSDIDLLVEFSQPVGMFEFLDLKEFLEGILKIRVDLATPTALKRQLRDQILKEAIRAA
jgi:predicted nucleotidyltransferase